ncbi:unnamed protein product [Miscanthus lutarioriparius]|uniref:Disease resistance protein At4g27190-like leucine-rich repeats domain-containing protein n=1 Tax=Miscanthus lutarioriparius TaxID=422564 RepID=A0A811S7Q1_9POAL|nr:unnamed protein product [Miscanthus lutarioriparius]
MVCVQVINADTIDAAAQLILHELKGDSNNVIYFDGWDGMGASAVLRAVAQCFDVASKVPVGLQFDQIIHVDSSKWQSKRALQRAIAEQLDLPAEVMGMFDRQDEEEDYYGVAQGSRAEIPEVLKAMYRRIKELNRRFLVIFHNGSSEEIDLGSYGFPLSEHYDNKVLWTFQGRFRLYPKMKVDRALNKSTEGRVATYLVLLASSHIEGRDPQEMWSSLVRQEAAEIITNTTGGPARVAEFFILFMMRLCCISYNLMMDYDLATHACNYWVCDGVRHLQQGDSTGDGNDVSWRSADALHLEMQLDLDYYHYNHQYFPSHLLYRTSPFSGFLLLPNADLFQDLGKITVLKLSRRTFSFTSPPFVHCHNLKFLWLDHCQDQEMISSSIDGFLQDEKKKLTQDEDGAAAKEYIQQCFKRLWVLDIRYTPCNQILSAQMMDAMTQLRELNVMGAEDWDMGQVQGRLPNICKLRITKSAIRCPSGNDADLLLSGMDKVQLLDFSGNQIMKESGKKSLPTTSLPVASSLETVIINDGCVGLEKISFRGCAKLKNILLKGSFQELRILDVSGTAVKTLDLSAVTAAQKLDELLLFDCGKLCAILWPPQEVIRRALLRKVCIDTTMQTSVSTAPRSREEKAKEGSPVATTTGPRAPSECDRFVSVRDARLLRSLVPLEEHFNFVVHVEISSPLSHPAIISGGGSKDADSSRSSEQPPLEDGNGGHMQQLMASEGGGRGEEAPTITQISPCPRAPNLPSQNCYTYIQDHDQHPMTFTIPDFICDRAMILHVHDSLSISSIPGPAPLQGSQWTNLKWCRVERCPMLECLFTAPRSLLGDGDACVFYSLSTFWASQLPKARFIWNWRSSSSSRIRKLPSGSFLFLAMLHLDCCPSLIHVLPMPIQGLRVLRTLEIMWCGDLVDVFPLEPNTAGHSTLEFHSLKHICLHELPKLKGICGRWRVYAPKLETIRIKGCWSLRRLPNVRGGSRVECSCEKEWWDSLQWERGNPNHSPSLYEPIHSPHYKKHLLRRTVLR